MVMRRDRREIICHRVKPLEGRVVLSTWGGGGNNFLGSLASVGIVTGGDFGGLASTYYSPGASQNAQVAQLRAVYP